MKNSRNLKVYTFTYGGLSHGSSYFEWKMTNEHISEILLMSCNIFFGGGFPVALATKVFSRLLFSGVINPLDPTSVGKYVVLKPFASISSTNCLYLLTFVWCVVSMLISKGTDNSNRVTSFLSLLKSTLSGFKVVKVTSTGTVVLPWWSPGMSAITCRVLLHLPFFGLTVFFL